MKILILLWPIILSSQETETGGQQLKAYVGSKISSQATWEIKKTPTKFKTHKSRHPEAAGRRLPDVNKPSLCPGQRKASQGPPPALLGMLLGEKLPHHRHYYWGKSNEMKELRFCMLVYIHKLYTQLHEQGMDTEAGEAGDAGLPKMSHWDDQDLQEKLKVSLLWKMCSEITSCSSMEDVSFSEELSLCSYVSQCK